VYKSVWEGTCEGAIVEIVHSRCEWVLYGSSSLSPCRVHMEEVQEAVYTEGIGREE
jgi:hypothetical protein